MTEMQRLNYTNKTVKHIGTRLGTYANNSLKHLDVRGKQNLWFEYS